ncbi:RNA polymerase sigma factor [Candidatus Kuenenbacteria bacterium]|nr:RNA polymerase sigma factor [Candidatus Kuenenbacteria bacterium]
MRAQKINKWQESKLLKRLKNGDEESFRKIYDFFVDRIYKYVFLKIGSKEKTEEIVQDVFLKFWRFAKDEENKVSDLSAFIYSIARSMIADHYRNEGKVDAVVSFEETIITEEEIVSESVLSEEIDISIDLEKVSAALTKLSQVYQDLIIMKYIEEMSNKEIAEILGKEEGNIRVLAHRAIKQLRAILRDHE